MKLDGKEDQKGKKAVDVSKREGDDDEISGDDSDDEGDEEEWEGDDEDDEGDNDEDDDETEGVKKINLNKSANASHNKNKNENESESASDSNTGMGMGVAVGIDHALQDRIIRSGFREAFAQGSQRVLFVVPSEPLVWQVAAFFSQLLRDEGDVTTKVALVTDQMTFNPLKKFDIMPQIVVGTPKALESSLTKVIKLELLF